MDGSQKFYLTKLEIYCGTRPERLVEPIKERGRKVTTDNGDTSVPLAMSLLKTNLWLVGTLKKNCAETSCLTGFNFGESQWNSMPLKN